MSYTLISLSDSPPWPEVCAQIKASDKDVVIGLKPEAELASDAVALSLIAYRDGSTGILAGTTLKLFPGLPSSEFPIDQPRVFSMGRKILTPMGLSAEPVNLRFGDTFYPCPDDISTTEAQSFWGSIFFIKKEVLQKIAGPDAGYESTGGQPISPNIVWDDLALQVLNASYKILVTPCVTAIIPESSTVYPNAPHPAYSHWEQKWGWNPLIPNTYHIRGKWQGTPIAKPLIDDLVEFWPCEQPPVDLIMLTGNSLKNLQRCLESLGKTKYPEIRFHILLNGSGSEVTKYVEGLKKTYPFSIDAIATPVNVGIPVGLNWVHTRCTAPIVARLDDDMEMPEDWLAEMVAALRQFPLAGAILPSMIHPADVPGKADEPVPPLRLCSHFQGVPNNMPPAPFQQTYQTNFLGGACVVFRRKAIQLAGDYDIRLTPTQNEDTDYGAAIRVLGYDLIVLGKIVSLHHSSSFSKSSYLRALGIGYQSSYFYSKWGRVREILELALDRDGRIIA